MWAPTSASPPWTTRRTSEWSYQVVVMCISGQLLRSALIALHDFTFLWPGGCRYDHVMNTNLKSVYRFCQMAHPLLKVSAGSILACPLVSTVNCPLL
jgi:hypothetical protein